MNKVTAAIKSVLDKIATLTRRTAAPATIGTVNPIPEPVAMPAGAPITPPTNFNKFVTKVDGLSAQIEYTDSFATSIPSATHTQLLELVVRLNNPTTEGLASAEDVVAIEQLRNTIMQQLPQSLYVGSVTSNGLINSYIYVPNVVQINGTLQSINTPLKYSYEVITDPSWQYYLELLPTVQEQEMAANDQQLQQLLTQGMLLGSNITMSNQAIVPVDKADSLIQAISTDPILTGMTVEKAEVQGAEQMIRITGDKALEVEQLTAVSVAISQHAIAQGGRYLGWEVTNATPTQPDIAISNATVAPISSIPESVLPGSNQSSLVEIPSPAIDESSTVTPEVTPIVEVPTNPLPPVDIPVVPEPIAAPDATPLAAPVTVPNVELPVSAVEPLAPVAAPVEVTPPSPVLPEVPQPIISAPVEATPTTIDEPLPVANNDQSTPTI